MVGRVWCPLWGGLWKASLWKGSLIARVSNPFLVALI